MPHATVAWGQLQSAATSSPVLPSAVSSSSRCNLHDVLLRMPLPTRHVFDRAFSPDIGLQHSRTCWSHSVGAGLCRSIWIKPTVELPGTNLTPWSGVKPSDGRWRV